MITRYMEKPATTLPVYIFTQESSKSEKISNDINKNIQENVERIFERTLSKFNMSIMIFSTALGIFSLIFGLFYFFKIRESEKLMNEIQYRTDEFFRRHYREQYTNSITDLHSENNIKRYNALKLIATNPEITANDFDVIKNSLVREFEYKRNIFVYSNINTIINILIAIDSRKTIQILVDLLASKDYDHLKMYPILQYIVVDEDEKTKDYIKTSIKENTIIGEQLVTALMQYGLIDEYSEFILEHGSENTLQQLIVMAGSDARKVNISLDAIRKRGNVSGNIINRIIYNKIFPLQERVSVLLHFYSKSQDKSIESCVGAFIGTINADEEAKKIFLNLIKDQHLEKRIFDFLKNNRYYLDSFKNILPESEYNALSQTTVKDDDITHLLEKNEVRMDASGKIFDKNGKEYIPEKYTPTMFGWKKPIPCIEIDGKLIEVTKIEHRITSQEPTNDTKTPL
jgi:hypothetical protein